MGINDEADKLFGPVDSVPVLTANGEPTPPGHTVKESDVFSEPTVAGELPKFDGVFEISNTAANKLHDLSNVQQNLQRTCAVCVEDALAIDTILPGFISDERPIGLFSEEPTKTQYDETVEAVDGAMDSQYQSLRTSVAEISKKLYTFGSECSKQYGNRYVTLLSETNRAIANLLFTCDKDEVKQITYVFEDRTRWSELMEVNIDALSNRVVIAASDPQPRHGFEGTFLDEFINAIAKLAENRSFSRNLERLMIKGDMVYFTNGTAFTFSETDITLLADTSMESYPTLTLGNLFKLLRTNDLAKYLDAIQAVLVNQLHLLVSVDEQLAGIESQETDLQAKINATVAINSIVSNVHFHTMGILSTLSQSYKLMCALRDMVVSLTETQGK